jgi:hypothetical protein
VNLVTKSTVDHQFSRVIIITIITHVLQTNSWFDKART